MSSATLTIPSSSLFVEGGTPQHSGTSAGTIHLRMFNGKESNDASSQLPRFRPLSAGGAAVMKSAIENAAELAQDPERRAVVLSQFYINLLCCRRKIA